VDVKSFQLSSSLVRSSYKSINLDAYTGKVSVTFGVIYPTIGNWQLTSFKYYDGSWHDCTIHADSAVVKSTNYNATHKEKNFIVIWDASEDLTLLAHTDLKIKLSVEDADGAEDDYSVSSNTSAIFNFDLLPKVDKAVEPTIYQKDTTPDFIAEVPSSVEVCNMHFILKIATNEALDENLITVDSSDSQTGWYFEIEEAYVSMLAAGCPDKSALVDNARLKYVKQGAMTPPDVFYWQMYVKTATKKADGVGELDLAPGAMAGYPCNY